MGGPGSDENRARRIDLCARANSRGSRGNGGRHQQLGGPAAWDIARSPRGRRPRLRRSRRRGPGRPRRRLAASRRRGAARPRSPCCSASFQPACSTRRRRRTRRPPRVRGGPAARRAPAPHRPIPRRPTVARAAQRAHLGSRREHAVAAPSKAAAPQGRERAETVQQAFDEIDLRLRERRVEPDAAGREPLSTRGVNHVASARRASGRCCRERPAERPRQAPPRGRQRAPRSEPPRSSRFKRA